MQFKSFRELSRDLRDKVLPQLPRDIGIVYGIPRSGMIPAGILATSLGASLGVVGAGHYYGRRQALRILPRGDKVLLVDDSIRTGRTLMAASATLGQSQRIDYRCAVYAHHSSSERLDFYAEILDSERMFEWNFAGTKATKSYCWDLDGVICTDPTVYDDDGEAYRHHISEEVRPLHLPQVAVRAIVTNRIERWRPETEEWLRRHGVRYGALIMQPFATATERRAHSAVEEFKARHLIELNGAAFIESHDGPAERIAALSRRPVLSVQSMRLYDVSQPPG